MSQLICYCFRVDKARILAAIEDGCDTVEALSERTRACTGCGGCRPDLEDLLRFYGEDTHPNSSAPIPANPSSIPQDPASDNQVR